MGINWDDFTHLHPDERFLTQVVSSLGGDLNLNGKPDGAVLLETCRQRYPNENGRGTYLNGGYFDAQCSSLNPNNVGFGLYVYGTLPLFIADVVSDRYSEIRYQVDTYFAQQNGIDAPPAYSSTIWSGYSGAHLVWRGLNAIADGLVILFIFMIGSRLHNRWVGLFAAAFYAAFPLAIQKAHFATVNSMANLFGVIALYYATRIFDKGELGDYIGFGLAFGCALSSRINLAPLVVLALVASGTRLLTTFDWRLASGEFQRAIWRDFGGLVVAGFVTILCFRLLNPYAFAGPGFLSIDLTKLLEHDHTLGIFNAEWLDDVSQAQYLVSGNAESPPNWQWVNRTGYVFPLTNMILWGMGAPIGILSWLGLIVAIIALARGTRHANRNLLLIVWLTIYFAWIGNLWVMSMRYYLPLYPALALLAAWLLSVMVEVVRSRSSLWRMGAWAVLWGVLIFGQVWALMFTNIYRNQLTRVQASHWVWDQLPGDFSMRLKDQPNAPLINVPIFNRNGVDGQLDTQSSLLEPNLDYVSLFTAPSDGVIESVLIPHLGAAYVSNLEHELQLSISTESGSGLLAEGQLVAVLPRNRHVIGDEYRVMLQPALTVEAGKQYTFRAKVLTPETLLIAGAIVSHEGAWDDPVPTVVCTLPTDSPFREGLPNGLNDARNCNGRNAYGGLVNGYGLELALDDIELKRERLKLALNNSDYIIISSNRFYDSQSRIPVRYPMTRAYYDALFGGELGFELFKTFQETFELGFLRVSDQHLPTMSSPSWLNEFEAEEAFHVYDHPVVFVFRKTDTYSSANTSTLLDTVSLARASDVAIGSFNSPDLVGVNPIYSLPADDVPTGLMLRDAERTTQREGGTWSERFDRDSFVMASPAVTVVLWWAVVSLMGWIVFPFLFIGFPALADRGYAFSKTVGLFLVAWVAWFATSLHLPLWNRTGLWGITLLLLLSSVWLTWRIRPQMQTHLAHHWRSMLLIEGVILLAFLAFLGVRLTNPDLWHPVFGGEKPMDFAYFNAVLRSTSFPPVDPWHAGGFINYYYFGFVIVGVPVLMLSIPPAIAYNLIIPTLFALTGIGAFSISYNLVAYARTQASKRLERVSPWLAGVVALLLAVALGNLGTPRVFVDGVAKLGGYVPNTSMLDFLTEQYRERHNHIEPSGTVQEALLRRASNPTALDEWMFQLDEQLDGMSAFFNGARKMWIEGAVPSISTNRWYWAPTRILAEPPVSSGNAITELPYFTFLYGDLHAHMISMPIQFLIVLFLFHEVVFAGRGDRSWWVSTATVALGAAAVGMIRGINTWDYPTYLLLCLLGLGYSWWLKWRTFNRQAIIEMFLRVGGFLILSVWLSSPYTRWYAAVYSSARLWEGSKTPLWAYFTIHGHFLFLAVSLLLWETLHWLYQTRVTVLRGRLVWLYAIVLMAAMLLLLSIGLYCAGWYVSLVGVPMIVWCGILFFRSEQSREMQFVLVLLALALAVTLGVEYIVIDGDIGRQNTVFKFYLQGWLLFSVVGGVALAWLASTLPTWRPAVQIAWFGAVSLLLTTASLYPITATRARMVDRMSPEIGAVLDGMAYMAHAEHYEVVDSAIGRGEVLDLSEDYQVIRWLQDNIAGTPIIMEAQSEAEYRWGSRISIYTGLPAVQGWNWHQRQQRTFDPMPRLVQQRVANVNAFYTTEDVGIASNILQHYQVEYVILSALEYARYPQAGIEKLFAMVEQGVLTVEYENGRTRVFKVNLQQAQERAFEYRQSLFLTANVVG